MPGTRHDVEADAWDNGTNRQRTTKETMTTEKSYMREIPETLPRIIQERELSKSSEFLEALS